MVFHGELGDCSSNLITYFESLGASPMNKGENPASEFDFWLTFYAFANHRLETESTSMNSTHSRITIAWMLNVLSEDITIQATNGQQTPLSFSYAWSQSEEQMKLQAKLAELLKTKNEAMEIVAKTEFAATKRERDNLMANRLVTIYWRSPAYNLARMMLSIFIGVFVTLIVHFIFAFSQFIESSRDSSFLARKCVHSCTSQPDLQRGRNYKSSLDHLYWVHHYWCAFNHFCVAGYALYS